MFLKIISRLIMNRFQGYTNTVPPRPIHHRRCQLMTPIMRVVPTTITRVVPAAVV